MDKLVAVLKKLEEKDSNKPENFKIILYHAYLDGDKNKDINLIKKCADKKVYEGHTVSGKYDHECVTKSHELFEAYQKSVKSGINLKEVRKANVIEKSIIHQY